MADDTNLPLDPNDERLKAAESLRPLPPIGTAMAVPPSQPSAAPAPQPKAMPMPSSAPAPAAATPAMTVGAASPIQLPQPKQPLSSELWDKASAIQNPFKRTLAQIGAGAGKALDIAGSSLLPGIAMNVPGSQINTDLANRRAQKTAMEVPEANARIGLENAQADEAGARATAALHPGDKPIGEAVADGKGGLMQEVEHPDHTIGYVPIPQTGGAPAMQVPGTAAPSGGAAMQVPVAGAKPGATEQKPSPAQQAQTDYMQAHGIPDTPAGREQARVAMFNQEHPNETPEAVAAAEKRKNDADTRAQTSAERVANAPEAAQERKDARTMGYAMDENGNLVYMSKADADKIHSTFEEMKTSDVSKDRQALRQLNDVQKNISRYRESIGKLTADIPKDHVASITRILADKDLNGALTSGATLGAMMDQINQGEKARAWNDLTPQERDLVTGYLRAKSSIIAYQKALTGIGRTNKETLDIEMSQLPSPIVGATAGIPQLEAFQENIDQASAGFPTNLPGMKNPAQVRKETEGGAKGTIPEGATPGMLGDKHGYVLNGKFHAD